MTVLERRRPPTVEEGDRDAVLRPELTMGEVDSAVSPEKLTDRTDPSARVPSHPRRRKQSLPPVERVFLNRRD